MGAAFTVARVLVVLLLLGATLWGLRKYDSTRTKGARRTGRGTRTVEVLGQARLSRNASVALVRVGDTSFAVGVSEKAVTLLAERPLEDAPDDTAGGGIPGFDSGPLAAGKGTGRPSFGQALFAQLQQLRPSTAANAAAAGVEAQLSKAREVAAPDAAVGAVTRPELRTRRAPSAPRPQATDGTVARVTTSVDTPRPTAGTRRTASRPARMPDAASLR